MDSPRHDSETGGQTSAVCGQAALPADALKMADSCMVVIFGATGDLAKRKLLPALLNLASRHVLPDGFRVLGVGRRPMADEAYRDKIAQDLARFSPIPVDPTRWAWLAPRISYAHEPLDTQASYDALAARLATSGISGHGCLYYLATPPDAMAGIIGGLAGSGLLRESVPESWRRVILEKPFGHDLSSARALDHELAVHLAESQIYRIDHYLGKETVQNLMAFRFANGIFEPVWNRRYVDHVQITVAETVGVEDRGAYYDTAGALRDMVQNHMFQLLALTAMEPPNSFNADAVRDERVKVLQAIRLGSTADPLDGIVRGQYTSGVQDDLPVPGYLDEVSVPRASATETYFAMRLTVDNWRWADVPFYLRTGKRLPQRVTEIAVQFRCAPFRLFRDTPVECLSPNMLVMRIQPDEGISLQFQAKVPGQQVRLGVVKMDFSYADYFAHAPNTGYETLLFDAMTGDQTLFLRADMVETGWSVVAPVLDAVAKNPRAVLHPYTAFSWGPTAADDLLAQDRRGWRRPVV